MRRMADDNGSGSREVSSDELRRLTARSVVVDPPSPFATAAGGSFAGPLGDAMIFQIAQVADEIVAWGTAPAVRDAQLRAFVPTESIVLSAISSTLARDASATWKLTGPDAAVNASAEILHNANLGRGWADFVTRLWYDVRTQDRGGYVEIVRAGDSPSAPVLGIRTLDAGRCWPTGIPTTPVVYQNREGRYVILPWYRVWQVLEMPSPLETIPGMQYCAVTRVLRNAQLWRSVTTYGEEKTSGRFTRAIQIVAGITRQELDTAVAQTRANADNRGLLRYSQPVLVAAVKPDLTPSVATVELATLPDGFDKEAEWKQYMTLVSLGLLTDFQEFAPLPGGNLGTSMQSEILHLKSRGKGPALFRKIMAQVMNFSGILPQTVTFEWDETDAEAEQTIVGNAKVRAETRAIQVASGELDAAGARQAALDAGDMSQELFDAMNAAGVGDLTENDVETNDSGVVDEAPLQEEAGPMGTRAASADRDDRAGPDDVERLDMEGSFEAELQRGFAAAVREIERALAR